MPRAPAAASTNARFGTGVTAALERDSSQGVSGGQLLPRSDFLRAERQFKPEGRAGVGKIIMRPDPSAHDLNQLFRDCQSETGATETTPQSAIGLEKGFEDALAETLFHSNAGVGHGTEEVLTFAGNTCAD